VKKIKTIYVGLLGGLGDLVLAAPVVAALKKKYPSSHLCFGIGKESYYDIIKKDPNIDSFDDTLFYYPPTKNVRKLLVRKIALLKRKFKYDLTIFLDNAENKELNKDNHIIDNHIQLCEVTLDSRRPIVYLGEEDESAADTILSNAGILKGEPFITVAPEARFAKVSKEWPEEKYYDLFLRIQKKWGIKTITFIPPSSQKKYIGTIVVQNAPTLQSIAAVIKRSLLYIGCDSGLTHVASAFDINMISIHSGYPFHICRPLSPKAVIVSSPPFLPAGKRKGPFIDPNPITVDEVFNAVDKLMPPA
jgi:ADP-heptose:LPS heptosyltransferase